MAGLRRSGSGSGWLNYSRNRFISSSTRSEAEASKWMPGVPPMGPPETTRGTQAVVAPPADREVDGIRVREQQAVPLVQAFRRQRFPVVGAHVGRDEGHAGFATLALNGMRGLTSDATPDGYADAPWVWVFSFDAAAAHGGFRGVPHCGFIGGQEVSREDLPDEMGLPVDWLGPADP